MAKKAATAEIPVATPAPAVESNGKGASPSGNKPLGKPKTVCPLIREQFMAKAPVLKLAFTEGGETLASFLAGPREFSTGSLGFNVSGKMTIVIDGKPVDFQVGVNVTAVGSKPSK